MSVRESERQKNCPSRGLGIAAAAIGVGVGAALYYFFSKRAENPSQEGTTSWDCEETHSLHEDSYTTISEHTTTDTSIESDSEYITGDTSIQTISTDHDTSSEQNSDSYISAEVESDDTSSSLDSSQESDYSIMSNDSIDSSESSYDTYNAFVDSENNGDTRELWGVDPFGISVNVLTNVIPRLAASRVQNVTASRAINGQSGRVETGVMPRITYITNSINRYVSVAVNMPSRSNMSGAVNMPTHNNMSEAVSMPSRNNVSGSQDIRNRRARSNRFGPIAQTYHRQNTSDGEFSEATQSEYEIVQDATRQNQPNGLRPRMANRLSEIRREENFRQREWKVEECSICFDSMTEDQEVFPLSCTHRFHQACILPWLEQHQTCPMCRKAA